MTKINIRALIYFILLVLCKSVYSTDSMKCEQLYNSKQYSQAFIECSDLDNKNNKIGTGILALLYYHGYYVKQDIQKSTTLFKKASSWFIAEANKGNINAQEALGIMYYAGDDAGYNFGVKHDGGKSFYWFTKAANQGDSYAQVSLGTMYLGVNSPVNKDLESAVYWYSKSARANYPAGQNALGGMYLYGMGVKQDNAKAFDLYLKAANQGDSDAMFSLGGMYEYGKGIEENNTKACYWYKKATNKNNDERYKNAYDRLHKYCND